MKLQLFRIDLKVGGKDTEYREVFLAAADWFSMWSSLGDYGVPESDIASALKMGQGVEVIDGDMAAEIARTASEWEKQRRGLLDTIAHWQTECVNAKQMIASQAKDLAVKDEQIKVLMAYRDAVAEKAAKVPYADA